MTTTDAIMAFVALPIGLGFVVIIAASLMRCRFCGGHHPDSSEDLACERRHGGGK